MWLKRGKHLKCLLVEHGLPLSKALNDTQCL